MSHNLRTSKQAFTLIELLVVIAIISILAAILFPVFARARENARRASCMSNLKQIGLGAMMYIQDYDEHFPRLWAVYGDASVPPYGWGNALQPYIKSTQVFQCPSESTSPTTNSPTDSRFSDYAYNYRVMGSDSGVAYANTLNLAAIESPVHLVLVIDSSTGNSRSWTWGCARGAACSPFPAGLAWESVDVANRHLGGVNIAFADGHVKWYKSAGEDSKYYANVYNSRASASMSGNNPTFNPTP